MIKTTKEIVDKWYDYQFRKTRGLSRQWLSVDKLKETLNRIEKDKGFCKDWLVNLVFPSPDKRPLKDITLKEGGVDAMPIVKGKGSEAKPSLAKSPALKSILL